MPWHTGKLIRSLLRERGMSADAFATKLGRSRAYLYILFKEDIWPPEYIAAAASTLGVNPDYLSGTAPNDQTVRAWVPVVQLPQDVLDAFERYRMESAMAELALKQSLARWVGDLESRISAAGLTTAAVLAGTKVAPSKFAAGKR